MHNQQDIDRIIADAGGWRAERADHFRRLFLAADPSVTEAVKWGSPVFMAGRNICSIGIFKQHLKIHFFDGAKLSDPQGLFNAGLEGKKLRGIDILEDSVIDDDALRALFLSAVHLT